MRKGFTLIEMMVVLVVIGIVIALVIPIVSKVFYEQAESVNQVQSILQRARFLAITTLDEHRVVMNANCYPASEDSVSIEVWSGGVWTTVEGPFELDIQTDLRPDSLFHIHFYQNGTAGDGLGDAPPQIDVLYKLGAPTPGQKSIRVYPATGLAVIM